jgi:hypothetical protein
MELAVPVVEVVVLMIKHTLQLNQEELLLEEEQEFLVWDLTEQEDLVLRQHLV